jgi:hypothetical protein
VVRDGKKWSVMVADYGSGSKILYNLGSFEREEDANRLLAKVNLNFHMFVQMTSDFISFE